MKTDKVTIGNATLYIGDCFDILKELDTVADAVISDPPFGITHCDWDKVPHFDTMWKLFDAATKPTANFVLFGCGKFSIDLINSMRKWYRYDLIWEKNNKVGFANANLMPLRNHEQILLFGRPGFIKAAIYNPQKNPAKNCRRHISNRSSTVYGKIENYFYESNGMQHPCSVLFFNSDKDKFKALHPTLKPVPLMQFLVLSYTNIGNIVLDPYMGSGTTGVACVQVGRHFIGVEKNRKYFDIACQRIEKAVAEHQNQFPEVREMSETGKLF